MKIKQKIGVFGLLCCFALTMFGNTANSQISRGSERIHNYQILVSSLKGDTESVKNSLLANVDPNTPPGPDDKGMTALMFAAWKGHTEIVELLLRAGADPNAVSTSGSTALMFASFKEHAEVVKLLMANGADANLQGERSDNTPLQTGC